MVPFTLSLSKSWLILVQSLEAIFDPDVHTCVFHIQTKGIFVNNQSRDMNMMRYPAQYIPSADFPFLLFLTLNKDFTPKVGPAL